MTEIDIILHVSDSGEIPKTYNVRYDRNAFEVKIDVQHYSPEELNVKLQRNTLTIIGKHEQKQDEHGYISRQFHREFEVPEDVNLESFESTVSEDGIMTLTADVKGVEKPEEKKINIKFEPKRRPTKRTKTRLKINSKCCVK